MSTVFNIADYLLGDEAKVRDTLFMISATVDRV